MNCKPPRACFLTSTLPTMARHWSNMFITQWRAETDLGLSLRGRFFHQIVDHLAHVSQNVDLAGIQLQPENLLRRENDLDLVEAVPFLDVVGCRLRRQND